MKKNKNILYLTSLFIDTFGTSLYNFILEFYILNKTHNALLFSTLVGISFLPRAIISLFSYKIVKPENTRKQINLMFILMFLLYLVTGIMFKINPHLIIIIAFIQVIISSFLSGIAEIALQTSIANNLNEKELFSNNSAKVQIRSASMLVAPAFGAVLVNLFQLSTFMILNAFSFLIALLLINMFKHKKISNIEHKEKLSLKLMLKTAFGKDNYFIRNTFLILISVNVGFSPLLTLNQLNSTITHNSKFWFTTLSIGSSIGIIFGPLITRFIKKEFNRFIYIIIAGTLAFSFILDNMYISFICLVLASASASNYNIITNTRLVKEVDQKLYPGITGIQATISYILPFFSLTLASWLFSKWSIYSFIPFALVIFLNGIYFFMKERKEELKK